MTALATAWLLNPLKVTPRHLLHQQSIT